MSAFAVSGTVRRLAAQPLFWPGLAALAFLIFAVLEAGPARAGWLRDTDDFFRLQQVRDLIAGQAWFEVAQSRFETPEGGAMHWSRLPDVPMAAMMLALTPLTGAETAERIAIFIWPLILTALAFGLIAKILLRLGAGPAGAVAGIAIFAMSGAAAQFEPNRIDHHGFGLVLGLAGLYALLSPARSQRSALIAALSVAAMMSVALENLPMAALLIAGFGLAWIVRGDMERVRLRTFGGALIVASLVFFVADAPGLSAARMTCDAFGVAHLTAMIFGGVLFIVLAAVSGRFSNWRGRLAAAMLAGAGTLGAAFITGPDCFGSPLAGLSDIARENWLDGVTEAASLPRLLETSPGIAVSVFGVIISAWLAGVVVWRKVPETHRFGFAMLMLMLTITLPVTLWQVRGMLFAHPAAALAGGMAIGHLFSQVYGVNARRAVLVGLAGFLAISPSTWLMIGDVFAAPEMQAETDASSCLDPKSFAALAALPPSRVMTPIDLGPSVLVRTQHTIFAAPYHRNVSAIERAALFWMAPPDEARGILAPLQADYVLSCPALGELKRYARRSPDGLAAQMLAGEVPAWLQPVNDAGAGEAGLVLYRVMPGKGPDF